MSEVASRGKLRYTWADDQAWADDQRWEIIDGAAYQMSPGPTSRHQRIVGELYAAMHAWYRGKPCQLFMAPMDVVLAENDVVQPDLLVEIFDFPLEPGEEPPVPGEPPAPKYG